MENEKKTSWLNILIICVAIFSFGKLGYRFLQANEEKVQIETGYHSGPDLYEFARQMQQQRYDNMDLFIAEVNKEIVEDAADEDEDEDEHFAFINMSRDSDLLIFTVKAKPGIGMEYILQDIKELTNAYCADEGMRSMLDRDFNIKVTYIDNDNKNTDSPIITRRDCAALTSTENSSQ